MPITFTKEEVKEFLEEQGFDVSDERTLKSFIHDLKKLIKYEDMKRRRRKLGHLPDETVLDSTDGRIPYASTSSPQETSSPYENDENSRDQFQKSIRQAPKPTKKSPEKKREIPRSPVRQQQQRPYTMREPQETSSPYENDSVENDENSRDQFQKSIRQAPAKPTKKSPEKKREIPRSPVRQQQRPNTKREPADEDVALTGSYGSDETTSYEHDDSARQRPPLAPTKTGSKESQKQQQRPPQRPLTENAMRSQPTTSAPPPSKKKGNRLIMKRITASQDINGDSIIEESDVDLGPVRRPYHHQPAPKKKPPVFARPKTAPSKQEAGASKPSRSEPVSRPMSSRSLNSDKAKQSQDKDVCDPEDIDTDELFQAISELIFPTGRLDSDESILEEDECKKHLMKPPPHVARDPVLLYHWYKTYNWDLYTIPGEDRHMKLRWNVRAKTVGGYHPCVEVRKIAKPKSCR